LEGGRGGSAWKKRGLQRRKIEPEKGENHEKPRKTGLGNNSESPRIKKIQEEYGRRRPSFGKKR